MPSPLAVTFSEVPTHPGDLLCVQDAKCQYYSWSYEYVFYNDTPEWASTYLSNQDDYTLTDGETYDAVIWYTGLTPGGAMTSKIVGLKQTLDYTITSAGWGTLILPFSTEKPAGVTVYECTGVQKDANTGVGTLKVEERNCLMANTPYILKGVEGAEMPFTKNVLQLARPKWLITMKTKSQSTLRKRFVKYLPLYILAIPSLAYLIVNNYMPMAGLVLAFKKYSFGKGIIGSPWNGLDNFKFLFGENMQTVYSADTAFSCIIHHLNHRDLRRMAQKLETDGQNFVFFPMQRTRSSGFDRQRFAFPAPLPMSDDGAEYLVSIQRALLEDGSEYYVLLNTLLTPVTSTVQTIRSELWVLTTALLLIGFLLSSILSRRISRPIIQTTEAARALSQHRAPLRRRGGGVETTEEQYYEKLKFPTLK